MKKIISIRIYPELLRRWKSAAGSYQMTLSEYIRWLVEKDMHKRIDKCMDKE